MKFLHLSDLHLGKRLYETSLIEDQENILKQIINIIDIEKVQGVLIAGDVYDKSVPSLEAVMLFDNFLVELLKRKQKVFVISGNHDSSERIAFGAEIMKESGIYLSPVYNGEIKPITLFDEFGEINVYMLPFIKPLHVRKYYEKEEIESYTDAVRVAIDKMNVDYSKRNVLIAHQFVTGATRSESEESIGGTDNVDATVFEKFDYVALGHLHGRQYCHTERIRYCGTPLKYSFSECNDIKSVNVVSIEDKNSTIKIDLIPLTPMRDMKKLSGTFSQLTDPSFYINNPIVNDYLQITLTDEDDVPNAMSRLQVIYKNALELKYDNKRTKENNNLMVDENVQKKNPYQLFCEFFEERNNAKMTEVQSEYINKLIEDVKESEL